MVYTIWQKYVPLHKKQGVVGGGYSNRTRATKFNPTGKVRKQINLQKKKVFLPSTGKTIKVAMTAKGLRTLKKKRRRENTSIKENYLS